VTTVGDVWARCRLYVEQRYPKLPRRLPPTLLAVLGAVALVWGIGRETPTGVVVGMSFLPLWVLAASWRLWRAPEEGLPQLMFWRSRQRRVCGRIAVSMLMGAGVSVMLLGYAYEKNWPGVQRGWATAALWLASLSPVPVLLDPLLWRAWTWPFRGAVRSARVLMLLQEPNRFLTVPPPRRPERGFDPDHGYCGRPVPIQRNTPPYRRTRHRGCRGPAINGEFISVTWDGRAITITEGSNVTARIPIEEVAELVTVSEYAEGRPIDEFLVLDGEGRRLATLDRPGGPSRKHLAELASAAGLPFADYELGFARESLGWLLFPGASSPPRRRPRKA
jgi:hypothetical protein